ncbi:hypothetical protein [Methylobacterium aquaticum]|uniref:hypothetical protein n=1 Tax=Methylobacterium aquaticum TaxID=270351 RepID=UPI000ACC5E17|nr:hypothetical protein [Methylobacterium aquaticum]
MSRLPESSFGPFKEQLLLIAKSTLGEAPSSRAGMVRAILKHSIFNEFSALRPDIPFELVSESEIFEAAYSDASGVEYFQGWLQDECEDINRTIDLLALHLAKQAEAGADWRAAHDAFQSGRLANQLRSAFISAAKSKCDWISCSDTRPEFHNRWINDFISFGPEVKPFEIQAKRLSAIKWICAQPWYASCVPNAMQCILFHSDLEPRKQISLTHKYRVMAQENIGKNGVGRPPGSGLADHDLRLCLEIDALLESGKAGNVGDAIIALDRDGKIRGAETYRRRRLADRYNKEHRGRGKALR